LSVMHNNHAYQQEATHVSRSAADIGMDLFSKDV
jgi:hypothetical protein